ncbi:dephospho-CoA kinase, partial [Candidatus Omnitrophota bacterium]
MFIIGITGSFGTGKTTVAQVLRKLGAKVIDADRIAREAMNPGTKVYRRIVTLFGKRILAEGAAAIDRKKLADLVFTSKRNLAVLCKIVHPVVIQKIKKYIRESRKKGIKVIAIDAPLLIEAGLTSIVDVLVVVKADKKTQFQRLGKRDFTQAEITQRIASQLPLKKKLQRADYVVDNSKTKPYMVRQVKNIWK